MILIKHKAVSCLGLNWQGSIGFREALSNLIIWGAEQGLHAKIGSHQYMVTTSFLLMLHNQNKVQHSINPCCQQKHCNKYFDFRDSVVPYKDLRGLSVRKRYYPPSYRWERCGNCQISHGTNNRNQPLTCWCRVLLIRYLFYFYLVLLFYLSDSYMSVRSSMSLSEKSSHSKNHPIIKNLLHFTVNEILLGSKWWVCWGVLILKKSTKLIKLFFFFTLQIGLWLFKEN